MKKISKEFSDKVQGPTLKKESRPEKPEQEQAQYKGKSGWGGYDSYAYGVKSVLEQARHQKGSSSSFLGKDKQLLDPRSHVDREMLHKKKK